MNHITYYNKLAHNKLHAPTKIFPSLEARREWLGDADKIDDVSNPQ